MRRVLPLLLLAVIAFTVVAATGDSDRPTPETTRFRVAILTVPVLGNDSTPLRLSDLGAAATGAIAPKARGPRADFLLGAVPYSKAIREKLLAREGAEVVYRGEIETYGSAEAQWSTGTKFPVQTLSLRGNQPTVSTTYEELGAKVKVMARDPDLYVALIEFTVMTLMRDGRIPIIHRVQSQGGIHLPDGYTAILSYMNRLDGDVTRHLPEELQEGEGAEVVVPTIATQTFVLLTRMDLAK